MHGLQIEKFKNGEYADLKDLFACIESEILKYKWSISDYELWPNENMDIESSLWKKICIGKVLWLSGEELIALAKQIGVVNWGAFLAFEPKDLPISYQKEPYSEGESGVEIQHPLAQIEIQSVDGGYFEIFSREAKLYTKFSACFEVKELV